jgi:ribosomal protein L28
MIQDVLNHSLQEAESIYISGWVQNRRRFEDNITLITLVDNLTLLSEDTSDVLNVPTDRLSCLVHPEVLNDNAGLYHPNLLAVGAKVQVEGKLVHDKGLGKLLLWVHQINLVRSSSRSVTIRYLLDLMAENKVEIEEAAEALMMPYNEALQVSQTSDATERQWKANQLAVRLQKAQSMRRIISPELLRTMEKYRPVAKRHPAKMTATLEEEMTTETKVMPMGMPGSKWMAKKKPQLEWMGQQIRSVLESHPDFGKRKLTILDIGGGKGSLANYLGQAIDDVHIHVIDICAGKK